MSHSPTWPVDLHDLLDLDVNTFFLPEIETKPYDHYAHEQETGTWEDGLAAIEAFDWAASVARSEFRDETSDRPGEAGNCQDNEQHNVCEGVDQDLYEDDGASSVDCMILEEVDVPPKVSTQQSLVPDIIITGTSPTPPSSSGLTSESGSEDVDKMEITSNNIGVDFLQAPEPCDSTMHMRRPCNLEDDTEEPNEAISIESKPEGFSGAVSHEVMDQTTPNPNTLVDSPELEPSTIPPGAMHHNPSSTNTSAPPDDQANPESAYDHRSARVEDQRCSLAAHSLWDVQLQAAAAEPTESTRGAQPTRITILAQKDTHRASNSPAQETKPVEQPEEPDLVLPDALPSPPPPPSAPPAPSAPANPPKRSLAKTPTSIPSSPARKRARKSTPAALPTSSPKRTRTRAKRGTATSPSEANEGDKQSDVADGRDVGTGRVDCEDDKDEVPNPPLPLSYPPTNQPQLLYSPHAHSTTPNQTASPLQTTDPSSAASFCPSVSEHDGDADDDDDDDEVDDKPPAPPSVNARPAEKGAAKGKGLGRKLRSRGAVGEGGGVRVKKNRFGFVVGKAGMKGKAKAKERGK
jgi:hypothetical protein